MSLAEQIGTYALATVFQLPFHILLALPWLLIAWVISVFTHRRVSPRYRFLLVSAVASVGLAPVYGAHLSMLPAYTLALSGHMDTTTALISFLFTWCLILAAGFSIMRVRSPKKPPGSNAHTNSAPVS